MVARAAGVLTAAGAGGGVETATGFFAHAVAKMKSPAAANAFAIRRVCMNPVWSGRDWKAILSRQDFDRLRPALGWSQHYSNKH